MLGGKTVEITAQTVEEYLNQEALTMLMSEEFLIHAAINLIANCISKCEFKTLKRERNSMVMSITYGITNLT